MNVVTSWAVLRWFSVFLVLLWLGCLGRFRGVCRLMCVRCFGCVHVFLCMVGPSAENGPMYIICAAGPSLKLSNRTLDSAAGFFFFFTCSTASLKVFSSDVFGLHNHGCPLPLVFSVRTELGHVVYPP